METLSLAYKNSSLWKSWIRIQLSASFFIAKLIFTLFVKFFIIKIVVKVIVFFGHA
jgi:hypothetical protein